MVATATRAETGKSAKKDEPVIVPAQSTRPFKADLSNLRSGVTLRASGYVHVGHWVINVCQANGPHCARTVYGAEIPDSSPVQTAVDEFRKLLEGEVAHYGAKINSFEYEAKPRTRDNSDSTFFATVTLTTKPKKTV